MPRTGSRAIKQSQVRTATSPTITRLLLRSPSLKSPQALNPQNQRAPTNRLALRSPPPNHKANRKNQLKVRRMSLPRQQRRCLEMKRWRRRKQVQSHRRPKDPTRSANSPPPKAKSLPKRLSLIISLRMKRMRRSNLLRRLMLSRLNLLQPRLRRRPRRKNQSLTMRKGGVEALRISQRKRVDQRRLAGQSRSLA